MSNRKFVGRLIGAIFLAVLLSGCAVKVAPYSAEEISRINLEDRRLAQQQMPPVTAAITLEEAMARALKYNLEHRTKMLEQSLAAGQFEAGRFDMLPKLMANAGYAWRDQDSTRRAIDSVTGAPSLANPFISSDREHITADLGLSWNLLDFGLGYYTSKQNADRLLIANEWRRKAMHTLIQNVRTAFWRAAAADKLSRTIRATIDEAEAALTDSRRVVAAQVRAPQEALRYQSTLLENLRLLEGVERELAAARIELAGLMGISPGTAFTLEEPDGNTLAVLDFPIERMEELALANNADLREQFYNARIAVTETRKAILQLLPGISFNYSYKYDDDSFLINQNWSEAGMRVGYNLFNILATPSRMAAADSGVAVAEARRMALQMSVLTQVHLARHQYNDAMRQYRRAVEIFEVDNKLAQYAASQEQGRVGNKLDRISANVTYILSSVRRYHALAGAYQSASRIQATLGLEPEIVSLDDIELSELIQIMQQTMERWNEIITNQHLLALPPVIQPTEAL